MNIAPLPFGVTDNSKYRSLSSSFIQCVLVLVGSLGFDIKGVWNGGISHTQGRVHFFLICMLVKLCLLINNGSRRLLCLDLGNETSLIHRWLNESLCVLQKLAKKKKRQQRFQLLQGYLICNHISRREADLRQYSPSAPCSCVSVSGQ